jgi:hypothetical protein
MRINDNGVEREMTAAEKTQHAQFLMIAAQEQNALEQIEAQQLAAAASGRAKLAALGLTEAEIAALVGA